jgi:diadenylate cyclase
MESPLKDVVERGIKLDALVNSFLLESIFYPGNPLHDGAVVIDGDRILAASCLLPLSQNQDISKRLGSRHRAALGITEETDALAIVVSEETGSISAARNGRMARRLDEKRLRRILERFYEARRDLFETEETI